MSQYSDLREDLEKNKEEAVAAISKLIKTLEEIACCDDFSEGFRITSGDGAISLVSARIKIRRCGQ